MDDRWFTDSEESQSLPLYTRANAGEVLPDPCSPLNVTFVWGKGLSRGWREGYVRALGTHRPDELHEDRGGSETIGNFGGYHYINQSCTRLVGARMPELTVESYERGWIGDRSDNPPYEPKPSDADPEITAHLATMTAWALTTSTYPEVEDLKVQAAAARAGRPVLADLSDAELLERARSLLPAMAHAYEYLVPVTNLSFVPMVVAGGHLAGIGMGERIGDLMSAVGQVDSAEPSWAMWDLSRTVRASATLVALFDQPPAATLAALRAGDDAEVAAFAREVDTFIERFGGRALNEWDIRSDSWETDPTLVVIAVGRMCGMPDSDAPSESHDRNRQAREKLTAEVADLLPAETRQSFLDAAGAITRFMPWRERTKTAAVRILNEMRVAFYELGDRAVRAGHLADRHDITMLAADELDDFVADPARFAPVIASRLVEFAELSDLIPPFFVSTGNVPPLSQWERRSAVAAEEIRTAVTGDVLHGVPGSPGKAVGRARIVMSPYDSTEFEPGDVLIAPQSDPAWTPLFVPAAAVVVNVGGAITHAVIVSRELGLPCVVSLTGATEQIADGDMVEVDGTLGTVRIL